MYLRSLYLNLCLLLNDCDTCAKSFPVEKRNINVGLQYKNKNKYYFTQNDMYSRLNHTRCAEPEWLSGLQRRDACGTDDHGFKPQTSTNACGHICKYTDRKDLGTMLTPIQSAGVTPEVNLRITQAKKHAKRIHPGFEAQGRCHQKSKTGVSVVPQKGLMSSKI